MRVINAVAPIRTCDLGGWTDTWFADRGAILNLAIYPYAEVQLYVHENPPKNTPRILIHAENFGDRYQVDRQQPHYGQHPMLEACIDIMDLPHNLSFEIHLYSDAPAGCSTGTSAAVSVALLGALDLLTEGQRTPHEVATLAHRVETEKLGLQCGIQDQLASAHGGICFIEMYKYPYAGVSQLSLANPTWWELERRMLLVFLGDAHSSSDVHQQVIQRLEQKNADKSALEKLRLAAHKGKNALYAGDFPRFAQAMIENTEAQAELHSALVSKEAQQVIQLAKKCGATGWKVNGAGGDGGSIAILCGAEGEKKRAFVNQLKELNPRFQVIPTYLSRIGLRRWMVQNP